MASHDQFSAPPQKPMQSNSPSSNHLEISPAKGNDMYSWDITEEEILQI